MVVTLEALPRLFLIRATIPLICLMVLLSNSGSRLFLLGLFLVNALDVLGGFIAQLVWQPSLWDYRFAVMRDAAYALVFYIAFILSPQVPALVLVPSVLTELFVLFGFRVFYRAVILEIVLIFTRMAWIGYHHHRLLHPAWSIGICVASVIMGLLGLEITRLEELQNKIRRQREQLKETLTEMLTNTLSPNGLSDRVLKQEDISQMLEEICQAANRSKGREIGQRLAQVIAVKQTAANLLTPRELEVLGLASEKKSYRQIAQQLQVSEGTVRAHAASIMRKAEVHNREEMVEWARKHRLLSDTQGHSGASETSEAFHHS
ncbi:helix-turn-helix transcriptional regulator [Ferviditalea candida]|uniref:LuxR C-terminal-related transcriptional regulator n=1 Tax=Ferviditalea candida TaxID=3108399 RepID=A0ABU5ZGH4_9BACL|nr:LuxR C-terminal-related transcriptional regulator [Paenibacillaceae bacterium T2]